MELVIAIIALAVLALVAMLAAARSRQTDEAVGMLSRETQRSDAPSTVLGSEEELTGKQVERAVTLERKAAAKELVLSGAAAPLAPYVPPDPEIIGVTRRQFFNRSIVVMFALGLSGFGAACIAFLWPQAGGGGFGSSLKVGLVSDLLGEIRANNGFLYKAEGRMWLTEYPAGAVAKATEVYSPAELVGMQAGETLGLDGGIIALYQKCPHLGCRVPNCGTSQWFECPCHGSQYNQVGEKRGGPAPRGMDRFKMSIGGGFLTVDTGTIIQGPAIGTNTTGQEAEGPHCIGGSHE